MSEQPTAVVPVTKSEFIEEYDQTFEVSALAKLVVAVSNLSGSVVVESWDQPSVHVHAIKRARSQRSFDRTHVELSQVGSEIRARTRIDDEAILAGVIDLLRGDRAGASVDYTVHMPAAGLLRAKNVNGAIAVSGLTHRCEASAINGGVTLADLGGQTDAGTVNGSLKATRISGAARLNTVNGPLDLTATALDRLDARTVSGSMRAALTVSPEGRYEFSTTNGGCDLTLPADTRCTLSMESVNGGVECALPHSTIASEMRPAFSSWQGAINGGGAPINVRTVNGRLRVVAAAGGAAASTDKAPAAHANPRSAAVAPETQPAPGPAGSAPTDAPAAPDAAETAAPTPPAGRSTMDILRAVERGELSVDDAMRAIAAKPKPSEPTTYL